MGFRIGSLVLYPQLVMFPLGAAFFLVISYRRLIACESYSPRQIRLALLSSAVLAALALFVLGDHSEAQVLIGGQSSFVGYWCALIGVSGWALVSRKPLLPAVNAVAAGVMAGGAVARLGCVFAGCCPGLASLPVFHLWPLYDMAALLAAFALGSFLDSRRLAGSLFAFLTGYGLLRFLLEFARIAPVAALGLTAGQWFASLQAGTGVALLVACRAQSATLKEKSEVRSQESECQ